MTLREVPVHTTVKVVKINGEGAFRRRIMDMGITKNSEIYVRKVGPLPLDWAPARPCVTARRPRSTSRYVRKVAPLGDPVEITVRGYELSLRRDDAESVEVVTV